MNIFFQQINFVAWEKYQSLLKYFHSRLATLVEILRGINYYFVPATQQPLRSRNALVYRRTLRYS